MAVRQLRTYLRRQKGARSLPRLRASPELFPGQSGKLLIKTNNTLTYLISCSGRAENSRRRFFMPSPIYPFMRRPAFILRAFFCRFGRISFLFLAFSFLSFHRLSVSTTQASFLVLSCSFFDSLRFPSNTFHRRTLFLFLVPSSSVSIPSPSPPRKNFEKRSLKTIFLNDKALVKK